MNSRLSDPTGQSIAAAHEVAPFPTPILLVVFNRPATTKRVLDRIRSVAPSQLYIAGDGARLDVPGEPERCSLARAEATAIDWPCSVHTLFREDHQGLARAMSSAINWFFGDVEDGIVLEDDCIPSQSFFPFCAELLGFYRENPQVMHISGNNFQYGRRRGNASYYFSRYPFVWGWASWRRAWEKFDFDVKIPSAQRNSWAAKWVLALERHGGAAIVPNVNLVENIGFGDEATHTKRWARFAFLPAREIGFPLVHPSQVKINDAADVFTYYANFRNIPHLRLMPIYRFWDWALLRAKTLKRRRERARSGKGARAE